MNGEDSLRPAVRELRTTKTYCAVRPAAGADNGFTSLSQTKFRSAAGTFAPSIEAVTRSV